MSEPSAGMTLMAGAGRSGAVWAPLPPHTDPLPVSLGFLTSWQPLGDRMGALPPSEAWALERHHFLCVLLAKVVTETSPLPPLGVQERGHTLYLSTG